MAIAAELSIVVRRLDEVLWAKQEIRRFASALPFTSDDLMRIEVVVSELGSNMVKHAGGGTLKAARLPRGDRWVLRLVALDTGPGIPNLAKAMKAGYSTTGTFGDGLATVREFMDHCDITTEVGQWTRIEVEKWAP